jgi:hypothetical protein
VYGDLCVDRETADVDGLRIFVRPAGAKPRVLFQYAEGGLLPPQPAQATPIPGGLIVEVPGDIPEATFSGRVIGEDVQFRSHRKGSDPFRLKRITDVRRAPYCRMAG